MTVDLDVVILTRDEELHLERAIRSVRRIAAQIVVVDSYSTDATVAIAEREGAAVIQHPFVNQSQQFNWALEHAGLTASWVMRLDADEVVEPDLADEIASKLPALGDDVVGVTLMRRHIFMGRWIRHGGRFPLNLLRIWRRGQGRVEDRWMDEHVVVWGGRTIAFAGGFSDDNLKDLTFFTDKHNSYATREAIATLIEKYHLSRTDNMLSARSSSRQASARRFVKDKIYNRLPFWLSSTMYFVYRYVLQLGFLDGRPGLIYHFLQGYWYRFLVGAKVVEFDSVLRELDNAEDRLNKLSELTGYDLSEGCGS
jgi:glycosyltransferase involved in cell wall biosynthesis